MWVKAYKFKKDRRLRKIIAHRHFDPTDWIYILRMD